MIPYFLLLFLPLLVWWVRIKYRVTLGKKVLLEISTAAIDVFMLILWFMLALRGLECGSDTPQYERVFASYSRYTFGDIIRSIDLEVGFAILCKFLSLFGNNYQFYLCATAAICIAPLWYFYKCESENQPLTIALFMFFPTFIMYFSGIRQALAMSVGILAWYAAREKKRIRFIALVLLAMQFHTSAFILFVLYPLYSAKITKNWLYVVVPLMVLIFINKKTIFSYALTFLWEEYEATPETGATSILWLLIIFAVYSYVIPDEKKLDRDIIGMRNILLLSVVIQFFAMLHPLSMRMNYYFLLFVPILIPKISSRTQIRFEQVSRLSNVVMTTYFFYYFVSKMVKDIDSLNIFPYIPFWQN